MADFRQTCKDVKGRYSAILLFHEKHPRFDWPVNDRTDEYHYYAFEGMTVIAHLQASGLRNWTTSTPYVWRLGLQEGRPEVRKHLLQYTLEEPGRPGVMEVDSSPLFAQPLDSNPLELKITFTYLPKLQRFAPLSVWDAASSSSPIKLPAKMRCEISSGTATNTARTGSRNSV